VQATLVLSKIFFCRCLGRLSNRGGGDGVAGMRLWRRCRCDDITCAPRVGTQGQRSDVGGFYPSPRWRQRQRSAVACTGAWRPQRYGDCRGSVTDGKRRRYCLTQIWVMAASAAARQEAGCVGHGGRRYCMRRQSTASSYTAPLRRPCRGRCCDTGPSCGRLEANRNFSASWLW